MAEAGQPAAPLFGPWEGLMEDNCDDRHVHDCLNVEFDGGKIVRRKGRSLLSASDVFRPLSVWWKSTNLIAPMAPVDYTATLTDNQAATVVTGLFKDHMHEFLYVGVSVPFYVLEWRNYAGQAVVAAPTIKFMSSALGFTALAVTDLTAVAGVPFSLGTTGRMVWNGPSGWIRGNGNVLPNTDQNLYWVQISMSADLTSTWTVSDLRVSINDPSLIDRDSEVNGLFDYRLRGGGRRLLVCKDFPGRYAHDLAFYAEKAVPRVFYLDMAANELVPLPLPDAAAAEPGTYYSFATLNGQCIFTNGVGAVSRYDGNNCVDLEAFPGEDSNPALTTNPHAYLANVPRGKFLAVYRNRLVIAGDRFSPNTVQISESDDFVNNIPAAAPVGGANVWPVDLNFDCVSAEDDPITGLSVLHDRLVIFKRRSLFVYDEISLRQVSSGVGCVAPRSIVNTGSHIFFLSSGGVFSFDGGRLSALSEHEAEKPSNIGRTMREEVDRVAMWASVGVNYRTRREYRLFVPVEGNPLNRLCLVFNYGNGRWTKYATRPTWVQSDDVPELPDYTSAVASVLYGDADEVLVAGDYSGRLYIDDVTDTDNGTSIVAFFVTGEVKATDERAAAFRSLRVRVNASGADLRVTQMPDGFSHKFALGEVYATLIDNNGDALRYLRRADNASSKVTSLPQAQNTAGSYDRVTDFKFPIRTVSRHMRYLVYSTGRALIQQRVGQNIVSVVVDRPHPWTLYGMELVFEPKAGKRK